MKALILAAGYGNRMRPLTDNLHKTLLKVGGETIMGRIIDGLVDNQINEIIIVTGYRSSEIKEYLETNYSEIKFQFIENIEYKNTNNVYSMALAFEEANINDDLILIESDLLYDPVVIKKLIDSPYPNAALVDAYRTGMDGTVVTVSDDKITNVIPPNLQDNDFDFSDKYKTLNIYKFSKKFCETTFNKLLTYYARVIDDNCYYELILGILIYMQREVIHAVIVNNEEWAEVDDPNDLRVADFVFNKSDRLGILENTFGGYWSYEFLDFCFIRNMYFPNASMQSEIKNNLNKLMFNYGSRQNILNQKLAYFLLCNKEYVNLLNGASQIYPIIERYFKEYNALIPHPTFGEYTRIFKHYESYDDLFVNVKDEIAKRITDHDLIVIVNPNNPTGTTVETSWIYKLAASYPDKIFLVDESFIEFSGQESIINELENNPITNIILVKSLSKSLGIPGIRLGYVYSQYEDFNAYLKNEIPIWNTNSIAEFFLEIILKHRKSLERSIQMTIEDREELSSELNSIKCIKKVYPSGANFILFSTRKIFDRSSEIVNLLLNRNNIYIKDVSKRFNNNEYMYRVAVRNREDNKLLIGALRTLDKLSA